MRCAGLALRTAWSRNGLSRCASSLAAGSPSRPPAKATDRPTSTGASISQGIAAARSRSTKGALALCAPLRGRSKRLCCAELPLTTYRGHSSRGLATGGVAGRDCKAARDQHPVEVCHGAALASMHLFPDGLSEVAQRFSWLKRFVDFERLRSNRRGSARLGSGPITLMLERGRNAVGALDVHQ
jgi:hypothetical protein